MHEIKDNKSYVPLISKWETLNITNLTVKIDEYWLHQEHKKQVPRVARYLTTATSCVAQYGLGFGLTQLSSTVGAVALGATGPVGVVVYGAAGTILMTQLGRLVKENVMPSAVAYLYAYVLERIGSAIAKTTVGAAAYAVSDKGFAALTAHPALHAEDQAFIVEFTDTLLNLPENVFPAAKKEQIRYGLGLEDTNVSHSSNIIH